MFDPSHALVDGLEGTHISEAMSVALSEICLGESVRYGDEDSGHIRALALMESPWPPIYVHRESMVVVDGVHRVHAAQRRGDAVIDVCFVDGPTVDAFIIAVRANSSFGKPLSLAERERAARRILESHPRWSDRAIAESCGLSGKTVGALRQRSSADNPQLNGRRIGRDGKARPVDASESRRRAADLLREAPASSLREVARQVGLSPATVKDVRDRLDGSVNAPREENPPAVAQGVTRARPSLVSDNALQSTDDGNAFAAWFEEATIARDDWERFLPLIPASRVYVVADAARACARQWKDFAEALESRANRRRAVRDQAS